MAFVTSIVAVSIAAVSTVASIGQQKKAGRASTRAAEARAAITKLENARERRNQVREARIAQGTSLARTAATGGFGGIVSSAQKGTAASITSQLRSNLEFIRAAGALNVTASREEIRASEASTQASIFSGIGNLAIAGGSLFT